MANTVTLTFAGDADKLQRAAKQSSESLDKLGESAKKVEKSFGDASKGIDKSTGGIKGSVTKMTQGITDGLATAAGKLPGILSNVVSALPPQGQAVALAIVGGLAVALGPMIGAAISSAILLGLGGGGLAAGIALVADNPKVKQAFGKLKDSLFDRNIKEIEDKLEGAQERYAKAAALGSAKGMQSAKYDIDKAKKELLEATEFNKSNKSLKDLAEPFVKPLERAAATFAEAFEDIKPALGDMFEGLAPIIDEFAPVLAKFIKDIAPGLAQAIVDSKPVFDALADNMPMIADSLGVFFKELGESGPGAAEFLDDLLGFVFGIIAGSAVVMGFLAESYKSMKDKYRAVRDDVKELWGNLKEFGRDIKERFKSIGESVRSAFKSAFNGISDAWNNTVGGFSFSVPGWVPGIGGNSFSIGNMPRFHNGIDRVPGPPGSEMMAILQAGERVIPAKDNGRATVLEIHSGGTALDDLLVEILSRAVRGRGGDVQVVLSGR